MCEFLNSRQKLSQDKTVCKILHCVWSSFLRSYWKILHLAKLFDTTSGCDGFDKYEVSSFYTVFDYTFSKCSLFSADFNYHIHISKVISYGTSDILNKKSFYIFSFDK